MAERILWLADIGRQDVALAGGKGANLGEMIRSGFPVPPGFLLTSVAYREFTSQSGLEEKIGALL